ncbi:MAG TPA: Rieske (2Fe-2S) protein [Verrucomicrobiae bacterium]
MKTEQPAQSTSHLCTGSHQCGATQVSPESIVEAQQALSRRSFVKTFGLFSVGTLLGGSELTSLVLAEVSPHAASLPGIFRMNLANFAALQQQVGSIRLRVTGMPTTFSEIVVSRVENDQFFAVTSRCTHEGQTVNPMNTTSRRIVCPAHGSQFQPDGTRVLGPATQNLTRYTATFESATNTLSITIPGLGFLLNATTVTLPSNQKRVRLQFPTVNTIRYRVQFRSALNGGSWADVPFSTTQEGPLTQTVLAATSTTGTASLFVEPSTQSGFYAVTRANS